MPHISAETYFLEDPLESLLPGMLRLRPAESSRLNSGPFGIVAKVKPHFIDQLSRVGKTDDFSINFKKVGELVKELNEVKRPTHRRFKVAQPHLLNRRRTGKSRAR